MDGVDQAGENANARWMSIAYEAGCMVAETLSEFTTDDIWRVLDEEGVKTHDNRAMGAVIKNLKHDGWCRPTMRFVPSTRISRHGAPIRRWKSLCG